jgi:hypothetical protein
MDSISSVGSGASPNDLLAQVGTTMLAKGLKGEEQQMSELLKGLGPAAAPLPEGSGQRVDLFA